MRLDVIVYVGRTFRLGLRHVTGAALAPDAILDEIPGLRHANVRVDVNDLHTLSADDDLARLTFGRGLRGGFPRVERKTK